MNYVYILECKDGSLYTGWTTNIDRRLEEHNTGLGCKYTRGRYPVKLRHLEEFATKEEALSREIAIKKLSRSQKLELIKGSDGGEGVGVMTKDFTIREALPNDAAKLLDYTQQVGSETHNLTFGAEGIPFTVEEEERFLESIQKNKKAKIYLALSPEAEIVGNATIQAFSRERTQHRANIAISVKKKFWGQGIGSALMQKLIDFSRSIGVELITLEVLSENLRAISLYEKFGFVKFGTLEQFYKLDEEYYAADYMKLKL